MIDVNDACGDEFGRIDMQPLSNLPPRLTKRLPTMTAERRFSKCCSVWSSTTDVCMMHLCWLMFIGNEGWNLHDGIATVHPLNSVRLAFSDWLRFLLYRTEWHCVYDVKVWKQTFFIDWRKAPNWRREHHNPGNVLVVFSGCTPHCKRQDGSIQVRNMSLRNMSTHICELFFLRMMASTSSTMWCVIQLAVYVRGLNRSRISLSYWPANTPDLTPNENLLNHLNWVVCTMDMGS